MYIYIYYRKIVRVPWFQPKTSWSSFLVHLLWTCLSASRFIGWEMSLMPKTLWNIIRRPVRFSCTHPLLRIIGKPKGQNMCHACRTLLLYRLCDALGIYALIEQPKHYSSGMPCLRRFKGLRGRFGTREISRFGTREISRFGTRKFGDIYIYIYIAI